jgi:heme-binding protein
MKKLLKPIGIILLVLLIIIQFFRPEKNIAASNASFANDITKVYAVPSEVQDILKTSCYDCHSNNTKYPWYANVQPVAWWLSNHVEDGKNELNFSEFATFPIRRKYKKMEEVIDEVKEGEMPLSSYTLLHKDARLSQTQKDQLINWATSIRDTIKATYPADSLVRKK